MAQTHSVVGVGVVVLKGDHVLLIRRGQPPRQGEWSIPGGRHELGETVRETAVREVLEETGVSIANLALVDVVDVVAPPEERAQRISWTLIDFRADWAGGEPRAGGDAAAAEWVPLDRLDSLGLWSETIRVITAARKMS